LKTLKFKYECDDIDFIEDKINKHSACVKFLYKKIEEIEDINLLNYCKERFNLVDIELRSVVTKVKQIKNSFLNKIKQSEETVNDIIDDIDELNKKLNEILNKKQTEKRLVRIKEIKTKIFKLNKKLLKNKKFIKSDIVFGGRYLLRKISFLNNNKIENTDDIKKFKDEFNKKRKGEIFLVGEANRKGNRFFSFDFINKTITYKPYKNKKIVFNISNRRGVDYEKLQYLVDNKQISLTISIDMDNVFITFDESILNGFYIDKIERRKEVIEKTKNVFDKDLKKQIVNEIYVKHYRDLDNKKLKNKLNNRYIGIDLNPDFIGYSIIDKINNDFKIIDAGCFNFKKLNIKSKENSDSDFSLYLNNKRKHEIKETLVSLFNLMKHYKVGYFVMEDLDFKEKTVNSFSKEFNRKVKNLWNRELIENLINKKCTVDGYILTKINPVYSSLIGNLTNKVFDPVAASIEISRRGAFKYDKGFFYPEVGLLTNHTMERVAQKLHIDVGLIKDKSWKEIHTILKKFRYRWGKSVGITDLFRMKSYKSKVLHLKYNF
jgi:IS605 OrfB family transposase